MATSMWQRKAHVGKDRREDPRMPCVGDTVIDVLNPNPRSAVPARVLDVGTSSLKIAIPFFLSPGAIIRIHMADSTADAEIRYCTCEGSEFHAGVRVEEIGPKSA